MKSKSFHSYIEFAVASNFSFLRGASHPEDLALQAEAIGLAGIGLCDRNSVAGVAALAAGGLRLARDEAHPLLGAVINIDVPDRLRGTAKGKSVV